MELPLWSVLGEVEPVWYALDTTEGMKSNATGGVQLKITYNANGHNTSAAPSPPPPSSSSSARRLTNRRTKNPQNR